MHDLNLLLFFLIGGLLGSYATRLGARLVPLYDDGEELKHGQTFMQFWSPFQRPASNPPHKGLHSALALSGGLLASLSFQYFGYSIELLVALSLIVMLLAIFTTDILVMIIPNRVLIVFLPIVMALRLLSPLDPWWDMLVGGAVGYLLIMLIIIVSKGGMGGGDMKLFGVLGLVFGLKETLLTFFLACLIGAVVGILMQIMGRTKRGQAIPFGPYIVLAAFLVYFLGEPMLDFYISFF